MKIADLIESRIENLEPAAGILGFLKKINGKKITAKHIEKMQAELQDKTIYLSKYAGMTRIGWGGYRNTGGRQGGELLIAYSETSVEVDAAWIEERNSAYFSAAAARNENRRKALNYPKILEALEHSIENYKQAKEALAALMKDDLFEQDRYAIEEAFGIEGR